MNNNPLPPDHWVIILVWVVLAIVSYLLFGISRNAALKRAIFPGFILFACALFNLFVVLLTGQLSILAFIAPASLFIAFLNIKLTKFCDACGATLFQHNPFTPMQFCPKCGAQLDQNFGANHHDHPPLADNDSQE